ncbi:MAG: hypothetical protein HFJ27_01125 [Clostridia bacterium]|nr:hypothetical protein [Clostridia bacterium]
MHGSATRWARGMNLALKGAVSGNVDFDGSKSVQINTVQSNIAVLEGNMNLSRGEGPESPSYNTVDLNFPAGFTKDNCVCLSVGIRISPYDDSGYSYEAMDLNDPRTWVRNAQYRNVWLGERGNLSKIVLTIVNPITSAKTAYYKIVLMKVQ